MRPQRPNSYTEMISDALDASGRKFVCAELGKAPSTLSRWTDPCEESGRRMSVQDLDTMCRVSPAAAAVIARHFAALAAGYFVPGDLTPEEAVAIRPLVVQDIDASGRLLALVEDRARGGADRDDAGVVPMARRNA